MNSQTVGDLSNIDTSGPETDMKNPHIKYYYNITQHTDEWLQLKCGIISASIMHNFVTPTLKIAANDKERSIIYELAAQRITGDNGNGYQSYDMQRGVLDEMDAAKAYDQKYGGLVSCGFITNDQWGFKLGFSPDGLVGDEGIIESKSRLSKYQFETILKNEMPADYAIQVQTGLLVTGRKWCDFNSYCGGLYMLTVRVYPDPAIQAAILQAAEQAEKNIIGKIEAFKNRLADPNVRLITTEKRKEEIIV